LEKLDPERIQARQNQRKKIKTEQAASQEKSLEKASKLEESPPAVENKPNKPSRYISSKLKNSIWLRDKGHCQYIDKRTGRKCESKYQLQLDHKFPQDFLIHSLRG